MEYQEIVSKVKNRKTSALQRLWYRVRRWEPLYWLRTHTVDRYHILDLRGMDGYEWGWLDRSHAIYLAAFKCLVEYVEGEEPFKLIDWDATPEHAHARDEIKDLYEWWTKGKDAERKELDEFFDLHHRDIPFDEEWVDIGNGYREHQGDKAWDSPENKEEWSRRYFELEAKEQTQLERLIKIRNFLWT